MAYSLPPPSLIGPLVMDNGPAADARRRKVHDLDVKLRLQDWRNMDPGRGPVKGWGGHGYATAGRRGR